MNLEEVLAFSEQAVVKLEAALSDPTQVAAFKAEYQQFVTAVQDLLGTGVAKYLVSHFTSELEKVKADFAAAVAKLHK